LESTTVSVRLSVYLYIGFSVQTLVTRAPANQSPPRPFPLSPNSRLQRRLKSSTHTHTHTHIKRIACLGLIAIFTKVVMIIVNNLIKTSSSQGKVGLQRQG